VNLRLGGLTLLFAVAFLLGPISTRADVVGGCNYGLQNFSDRGSVVIYNRDGAVVMQMVLDDDVNVFPKLKFSTATGDQAREEAKANSQFSKEMADAHIFPADVRTLNIYLADPVAGSSDPAATYYGFYGDRNLFLGGFGSVGKDWYVCDWQ